jgi:hypothetical protein
MYAAGSLRCAAAGAGCRCTEVNTLSMPSHRPAWVGGSIHSRFQPSRTKLDPSPRASALCLVRHHQFIPSVGSVWYVHWHVLPAHPPVEPEERAEERGRWHVLGCSADKDMSLACTASTYRRAAWNTLNHSPGPRGDPHHSPRLPNSQRPCRISSSTQGYQTAQGYQTVIDHHQPRRLGRRRPTKFVHWSCLLPTLFSTVSTSI